MTPPQHGQAFPPDRRRPVPASVAYDPKHPTRPVPLKRQAEVLAIAAARWWSFFHYTARTKEELAYKLFDGDAALADGRDTLALVAELSRAAGGDDEARKLIRLLIAELQASASVPAPPPAPEARPCRA